jgi:hypothetical protein
MNSGLTGSLGLENNSFLSTISWWSIG